MAHNQMPFYGLIKYRLTLITLRQSVGDNPFDKDPQTGVYWNPIELGLPNALY
jgi:hypothetical protein